jgi:cell division protein ZapA
MPDVTITIGGRSFEVACQEGEEHFLQAAARMLDAEASVLVSQIGHLNESRMLLMAGLMLADKTAGMEDSLRLAEQRLAEMEAQPAVEVRVPVIPDAVTDTLAELAARAEAIAAQVEEKAAE